MTVSDSDNKEKSNSCPKVSPVDKYQFILDCSSGAFDSVRTTLAAHSTATTMPGSMAGSMPGSTISTTTSALVNGVDEEGTPALNYAVMLGHFDICKLLMDHGADPTVKDAKGRDAKRWAARSSNPAIKNLILNGTLEDTLVIPDTAPLDPVDHIDAALLDPAALIDTVVIDTAVIDTRAPLETIKEESANNNQSGHHESNATTSLHQNQPPIILNTTPATNDIIRRDSIATEAPANGDSFDWNSGKATEMIPFDPDDASHILNVAIRTIVPSRKSKFQPLGANVLFLCARYACYHTSVELANIFLMGAVKIIRLWVKDNTPSMTPESPGLNNTLVNGAMTSSCRLYWLSNAHQLLIYLKRDGKLVSDTIEPQLELTSLIDELLASIMHDMDAGMAALVGPALIDWNADESKLELDFFGFAKRSSAIRSNGLLDTLQDRAALSSILTESFTLLQKQGNSIGNRIGGGGGGDEPVPQPASLASIFVHFQAAATSSSIHPSLIAQLLHHLCKCTSRALQSHLFTTRSLSSRSRAQQVMLNISDLSSTLRAHNIPTTALDAPLRILQFIQVVGTCRSVSAVRDVSTALGLSWHTMGRVVSMYRYERGEQSLASAVEVHVSDQMAAEQVPCDRARDDEGVKVPMQKDEEAGWKSVPSVPRVVLEIINQTA